MFCYPECEKAEWLFSLFSRERGSLRGTHRTPKRIRHRVPGLNALAGVRYYITRRVAVSSGSKYNRVNRTLTLVGAGVGSSGAHFVSDAVEGCPFLSSRMTFPTEDGLAGVG